MKNLTLLFCFALLVIGTSDVSAFILFPGDPTGEVLDNGPRDADLRWGYISLAGPITLTNLGGIKFSNGSATAGQSSQGGGITHWLKINGDFINDTGKKISVTNEQVAKDNYNFPFGDGRNYSWFVGVCADLTGGMLGQSWFQQASFGTTFSNNAAVARWDSAPLPSTPMQIMSASALRNGTYQAGEGLHYLEISFVLDVNEMFSLPDNSLDGKLEVVPEPATFMLLSLGGLALLRRRRGA